MTDSSRLSTYKMYTIGWIAALDKELTAALAMLDETHEQPDDFEQNDQDSNTYSWGRIEDHNIVIASLGGGSYGLVSAAATATCMANSLPHLRFGLLVGIGAGVPDLEGNDVRLGDVVVSLPKNGHPGVVQYDLGKVRENDQFQRVGALAPPPTVLLKALDKLRAEQRLKGSKLPQILSQAVQDYPMLANPQGKDPAFVYQGAENDRLFEPTSVHVSGEISCQDSTGRRKRRRIDDTQSCTGCDMEREIQREERPTNDPEIHYGTIASGNSVIKDGVFRDKVFQRLGTNVLCYEMEAAGLMNNFPCLVIRGVCDYADSHKNDRWQNYAALAAAAYAKELLNTIDARKVELADKIEEIVAEVSATKQAVSATKQAVQSMSDERQLEKVYTWLSAPDPSVNYHTALSQRHTGTCDWFLRSEHYKRWKTKSASPLWIHGGPGCGKTILSSVIISDLKVLENDTQHLLFFFFSFTDSKKQSLDGVVRSLTSQLSRKSESARAYLTSTFKSKYEKSSEQPSTAQLCEIFECMLQRSNNIWIVLDALDECQLGSTFKNEGLLSWLQSLLRPKHDNLQILVTSRREHNIRIILNEYIPDQLCLQGDLVTGDIKAFIDETIRNWDGLKIWQEHEQVQAQIRDYLTYNSDGMFRWVSCQLDALAPLQGCRDHEALLATLKALPKSLDGIYARILDQIPEALRAKAHRILQFLLHSETPVFLEETVEIAVFSPKSERSTRRVDNSIKPDKNAISLYCPNLVECVVVTDEVSGGPREVLQLAHCSVRDFLLSDRLEQSTSSIFQPQIALGTMAEICLSYLLDIKHDQPMDQILSCYPLAEYAACFWTQYAKQADTSMILENLQDFIHREDCYELYCQLLDIACSATFHSSYRARWLGPVCVARPIGEKSFLPYSMLEHFAMRGLVCAVEEILHEEADAIDADGAYFGIALQEASFAGHKEVISLLLNAGANIYAQGSYHGNALQAAVEGGHQKALQTLLNIGANIHAEEGHSGNALKAAADEGHQEIVQILLDAGADSDGGFGSALEAAVKWGHQEIVQILLKAGANPNGEFRTVLEVAAQMGRQDIVQMLLKAGANPNGEFRTALEVAAQMGRQDIVQMLLKAGAKPNAKGGYCSSALRAAVQMGRQDIVQMLLKAGANPNSKWGYEGSPLNAAVDEKEKEIVRMLLNAGADYGNALGEAAYRGNLEVIQTLLDAGADPNAATSRFDNILSAVVEGHHEEAGSPFALRTRPVSRERPDIIKLLVCKGATVDTLALRRTFVQNDREMIDALLDNIPLTDSTKYCISVALSESFREGHYDFAQLLLDAGAGVDTPDEYGNTALYVAAARGLESMFEILLNKAYAASESHGMHGSSVQKTSLIDGIGIPQLLLMDKADAKRLLGKALVHSSSPGSRDTARLLFQICQAYGKERFERAPLDRSLARAITGVKRGCDGLARLLLDEGADPNTLVNGEPGLCYLVNTNKIEDKATLKALIELLIDRGADTKMRGPCSWYGCALDAALWRRRWELVGMLRDAGVEKTPMYRFLESKVDRELYRLQE